MEKPSVGSSDFMAGNQSVLIDLSSGYKDLLAPKIELIRHLLTNAENWNSFIIRLKESLFVALSRII